MFGERLQELRNKSKLSQEKLAELVGVSRQAVSKWENNLSYPDTKNLIRLSEIFNVSMDELLSLTQNIEQKDVADENKISKEVFTKDKIFYYNETRTKLISYIILIAFSPLNIYFYNKGVYGEVYIELGFLGKEFFKQSLYDMPFIIITVGLLIKFIKDIKNAENTMMVINKKDKIIGYLCSFIVSLIIIVIYFKMPEFSSIAMFLGMFALVYISIFEIITELSKKILE